MSASRSERLPAATASQMQSAVATAHTTAEADQTGQPKCMAKSMTMQIMAMQKNTATSTPPMLRAA